MSNKPKAPTKKKTPASAGRLPHATLKNPTIEAILGGHFRFATAEQAQTRLESLRESFMVAKPTQGEAEDGIKLWIRGFGMTAEAREAGYLGNFAQLRVARADGEKWTITATLLNIDKKFHPERRQVAQKFPNWGHPILRDVLKGRIHQTAEAAQGELQRLHEAFPEVTIPLATKQYIMVYRKSAGEGKSPVEKWVLEIEWLEGKGYRITHALNEHAPAAPKPPREKAEAPTAVDGKFASQVMLSRRRRKTPVVRKRPTDDEKP
jgi:hypothetical protein